ncbi:hypothetical protein SANA_00030 [Gottschalkiaceae bacterium SANA]|nr:hypothetical protein SANA_00030 [Gottschalkiaceae bacterium SANA]
MEKERTFVFWGNRLFDCMILNFLWILTVIISFGIATGAANMALFHSISKGMKKDKRTMLAFYVEGIRTFWKQGTYIWGIQLLVFFVIFLATNYGLILFGNLANFIIPFYGVFALEVILLAIYFFPLYIRKKKSIKTVMIQSFRLAHSNLFPSLILLASMILAAFLVIRVHLSFLYFLPSILAWWIDYWVNERIMLKYDRIEEV